MEQTCAGRAYIQLQDQIMQMKRELLIKSILISACCLCGFRAISQQVSIGFNPAVYGQSMDGLALTQLSSTFTFSLNATLTIRVRESSSGNVVVVNVPNFIIQPGNNILDRGAFSRSVISFGNNAFGKMLSQSGRFPEGEYEYCFELDISESKGSGYPAFFENCFVHDLQPITPLLLINPIDGDQNCNTRPQFIWQPPMPMLPGARFRLVLVELRDRQDIVEAINMNPPVINQGNLSVNQLNYPHSAPQLVKGKKYAWQVTVYFETTMIRKSEIWVYEVQCDEEQVAEGSGYRELKEDEDNYYVAVNTLRFSFNNPYSAAPLNYWVVSMKEPALAIKGLPTLPMQPGLNKFEIDLFENSRFKEGEEYQLIVKLLNGRLLKLRFIYKNE